jgi:hypothetical protein
MYEPEREAARRELIEKALSNAANPVVQLGRHNWLFLDSDMEYVNMNAMKIVKIIVDENDAGEPTGEVFADVTFVDGTNVRYSGASAQAIIRGLKEQRNP